MSSKHGYEDGYNYDCGFGHGDCDLGHRARQFFDFNYYRCWSHDLVDFTDDEAWEHFCNYGRFECRKWRFTCPFYKEVKCYRVPNCGGSVDHHK